VDPSDGVFVSTKVHPSSFLTKMKISTSTAVLMSGLIFWAFGMIVLGRKIIFLVGEKLNKNKEQKVMTNG
jgi:phosphate/sulfate permease